MPRITSTVTSKRSSGWVEARHAEWQREGGCSCAMCRNGYNAPPGNVPDAFDTFSKATFSVLSGGVYDDDFDSDDVDPAVKELKELCFEAAEAIEDDDNVARLGEALTAMRPEIPLSETIQPGGRTMGLSPAAKQMLNRRMGEACSTLLGFAAKFGALECTRHLLYYTGYTVNVDFRAALDSSSDSSTIHGTPLMYASHGGHLKVMSTLLSANANVNMTDDDNMTALHVATISEKHQAMQALLDAKANPNAEDDHGLTPLSWAARDGYEGAVRVLAEYGADLWHEDGEGKTPMDLCAEWDMYGSDGPTYKLLMKLARRAKLQAKRAERHATGASTSSNAAVDMSRAQQEADAAAEALLREEEEKAEAAARAAEKAARRAARQKAAAEKRAMELEAKAEAARREEEAAARERAEKLERRRADREARRNASKAETSKAHEMSSDESELRKQWGELLEEASRSTDPAQQDDLRARLEAMMSDVQGVGISVKQGKKVLQRLVEVKPARNALTAAMTGRSLSALKDALAAARKSRSLLPPGLYEKGESLVVVLKEEEDAMRWKMMAAHVQSSMASLPGSNTDRSGAPSPAPHPSKSGLFVQDVAFDSDTDSDRMEEECVVCFDGYRTHVCVPCAHTCLCGKCADKIFKGDHDGNCPICRDKVIEFIELL